MEDWIKCAKSKMSVPLEDNVIEQQLRINTETVIECQLKKSALQTIQECGNVLIQEGHLSSVEVDPRLNYLKNALYQLDLLINQRELQLGDYKKLQVSEPVIG